MKEVFVGLIMVAIAAPFASFAQTLQISVHNTGLAGDGISANPDVVSDGSLIAFDSEATNLVDQDSNAKRDVFVHHQTEFQSEEVSSPVKETMRVSVADDEAQANGDSHSPSISSSSGRFVVFVSAATNLVEGDTNGFDDIFVRDRTLGETYRVSSPLDLMGAVTGQANGNSHSPQISSDGCYLVFSSDASNLDALDSSGVALSDTNGKRDIFLYYNPRGQGGCSGGQPYLELVSIGQGDQVANDDSYAPYFSSVRFITFTSKATNLVSGDSNNVADIFLRDRAVELGGQSVNRLTSMVSITPENAGANGESFSSSMDGPDVIFDSVATDLVSGDTNGKRDVFRRRYTGDSRSGGETSLVSKNSSGAQGNGDSFAPVISSGSNYIAFLSDATNLSDAVDCNQATDVFVRDNILDSLRRVNLTTSGYQSEAGFSADKVAVSGDGLLVAYQTAGKMNASDGNGLQDVYISIASQDPSQRSNPLMRGERLDEKPDVCTENNRATVLMERFTEISSSRTVSSKSTRASFPCRGRGICYQTTAVPVKANGGVDRKRTRQEIVGKRNQVTIQKLKPGNYAVSFRVIGRRGSTIIKTNQSPKRIVAVR